MKKKILLGVVVLAILVAAGIGAIMLKKHYDEKKQSGILLAFDDHDTASWETILDLMDEYDVKVTFFVTGFGPDEFCETARARGHEIGFHTIGHMDLNTLLEEHIIEQAIDPIEGFREQGYELKAFAYPYGSHSVGLDEMLLEHYDVVRGAYYHELRDKDNVKGTFIDSMSIDNVNFTSDEEFQNILMAKMLEAYENPGTVVSFYSHSINDWAEWAIPVHRLEFIFETAQNLGLEFYTYSDLME